MRYGYCRVSTDMQECSVEAQVEKLNEICDEVFVDDGVSGAIPLQDRPAGKRMWDRLQRGDTVAITTRDRAFRSLVDAASTLMRWREEGIKLMILDCPVDLSTDEGELVFLNGAVFSQYERRATARRTKAAAQRRIVSGKPYGTSRPYGYVVDGDRYVPHQGEQDLGRKMLAMRADGMSYNAIALACMDCRKPAYRKKNPWYTASDVRRLMLAASAGYPRLSQASWQAPDCEQRLAGVKSHESPR